MPENNVHILTGRNNPAECLLCDRPVPRTIQRIMHPAVQPFRAEIKPVSQCGKNIPGQIVSESVRLPEDGRADIPGASNAAIVVALISCACMMCSILHRRRRTMLSAGRNISLNASSTRIRVRSETERESCSLMIPRASLTPCG